MFSGVRGRRERRALLLRVSHELRTPLNAILGFTQLLAEDDLSDSQRDCLEQIMLGAQHLLEVSEQLLEVSHRRRRNADAPVELTGLVTSAVALCGPLAAQHGLSLAFTPPAAQTWALADERRLFQVLLNLLSNAIKYNRPRGSITVELHSRPRDGVYVEVGDTGIGIAPERLPRAFAPFERLDAGERGIEGVGLGLSLSRTMIEAMGGTISVRSVAGSGSTFSVRLRRAPATRAAPASRHLITR